MRACADGKPGGSARESVRRLAGWAIAHRLTVATAESCTGGLLGKALTDLPGASAFYAGGVIAYADDVKIHHLRVDPEVLETHGAVSRIVALQMACGACRRFSADLAMAVTGIAGPGGGTEEKPVGTVWLAVARSAGSGVARVERFDGDRDAVREHSVAAVLSLAVAEVERRRPRTVAYGPSTCNEPP